MIQKISHGYTTCLWGMSLSKIAHVMPFSNKGHLCAIVNHLSPCGNGDNIYVAVHIKSLQFMFHLKVLVKFYYIDFLTSFVFCILYFLLLFYYFKVSYVDKHIYCCRHLCMPVVVLNCLIWLYG